MNKVGLSYIGWLFNDYIGYLIIGIGSLVLEQRRRILFEVGHRGRIFWGHYLPSNYNYLPLSCTLDELLFFFFLTT